jgi:hypothetical protein
MRYRIPNLKSKKWCRRVQGTVFDWFIHTSLLRATVLTICYELLRVLFIESKKQAKKPRLHDGSGNFTIGRQFL